MKETGKKVLVIEDDVSVVDLLCYRLKESGYSVLHCYDGYEGLKLAQNENPDLIILDVGLPKLSGYKVCRLLKFDAKYKHIPVIMLTSHEMPGEKKLGQDTGADEYVFKSDLRKKLFSLVDDYLKPFSD